MCVHQGIQELIMESGSLLIVDELKAEGESMSLQWNLVTKIKELMKALKSCKIQHIGHLGNEAAYRLARYAWHVDGLCLWWESFPAHISQLISSEKYL